MSAAEAAAARVAEAVSSARRYRGLDAALVRRIAAEELPRARSEAEAVKRVKRRLHQAVSAYRPEARSADLELLRAAWSGTLAAPAFRDACRSLLARHASTRERLDDLDGFYARIWRETDGVPSSVLDLGCGLGPLSLPWMGLPRDAGYRAVDVDAEALALVDGFMGLVGQPHEVMAADLAVGVPRLGRADVALLLKLAPLLDRRDPAAALRLVGVLDAGHAVISFPLRSLGGHTRGMERSYRARLAELVDQLGGRVLRVTEVSTPVELVFVLALVRPSRADG